MCIDLENWRTCIIAGSHLLLKCSQFNAPTKNRTLTYFYHHAYMHECDECNKQFSRNYKFKRHKNTVHNKSSIHVCDMCLKCFLRIDSLSKHLKIHETKTHKRTEYVILAMLAYPERFYVGQGKLWSRTSQKTNF